MGRVQFNTDLFEAETISRMLEHLQRLLESASTDPAQHISEVKFLSNLDHAPILAGRE